MKPRVLSIMLAAIAAVAALTLLAGCGSSPTLDKYFQDHEDEWTAVEDQMKDMAGEMFTLDLTIEGNQIKQVMTYTETFSTESVADMKKYFEDQESSLRTVLSSNIAQLEEQTGIEGITWSMQYKNGDGAEIYAITVEAAPKDAAAADNAATEKTDTSSATEAETSPAVA